MKKITKLCLFMFIGIMSLALFSCSQSLEAEVQNLQKDLPYDCGNGMKMTECTINGDYLEMIISSDESLFAMDDPTIASMLKSVGEEMGKQFSNDKDYKAVVEACKAENKGMRILMKGEKSGASITIFEKSADDL